VLELELSLGVTARTTKFKGASSGALDGVGGASDGGILGFLAYPLATSGGTLMFDLSEGPSVGAPDWEWSPSNGAPDWDWSTSRGAL
jgi:hypothetical protein